MYTTVLEKDLPKKSQHQCGSAATPITRSGQSL